MTTETERRCEEWCRTKYHTGQCFYRGDGGPCWCSPECARAGLRYWDGRDAIERLAARAAMGEPRVVSGTDAGEGTVAKPDHVALGQRWRDSGGAYTVTGVYAWSVRYDAAGLEGDAESAEILEDEYLGTVPAPAETPPPASVPPAENRPGETCIGCDCPFPRTKCPACEYPCLACRAAVPAAAPAETPAPPGHAEVTHSAQDTAPLVTRCGLTWTWAKRFAWTDGEDATPVTCPACLAAAPAPGVGEGARELTFAEACKALDEGEAVEVNFNQGSYWVLVSADFTTWNWNMLARWATYRYRLKPEPLPAPAPGPGRVAEMVEAEAGTYEGNTVGIISTKGAHALCKRVVDAHQEEIRLQAMDAGWCDGNLEALELVQDRARAAMLEPKP